MKKHISLLLALVCVLGLVACSANGAEPSKPQTETNRETYQVEIADDHPIAGSLKNSYEAGEQVTIQLETVTEQYYIVRVNGVSVDLDRDASDLRFTCYTFTMPNEDVVVEIEEVSVDIPETPDEESSQTDTAEDDNGVDPEITEGIIRFLQNELLSEDKNTLTFEKEPHESMDIRSDETAELLFRCIRNSVRIADLTGAALKPMEFPIKMNGRGLVPSTFECLYIDYPETEQFLCIVFTEEDSAALHEYVTALAAAD